MEAKYLNACLIQGSFPYKYDGMGKCSSSLPSPNNPSGSNSSCVYDDVVKTDITGTYNQNGGYQISFLEDILSCPILSCPVLSYLAYEACTCCQYCWEYRLVRCKSFWHMEWQVSYNNHIFANILMETTVLCMDNTSIHCQNKYKNK